MVLFPQRPSHLARRAQRTGYDGAQKDSHNKSLHSGVTLCANWEGQENPTWISSVFSVTALLVNEKGILQSAWVWVVTDNASFNFWSFPPRTFVWRPTLGEVCPVCGGCGPLWPWSWDQLWGPIPSSLRILPADTFSHVALLWSALATP